MAKIKITNLVKFYALLLLYEGPKHGYEIIKEISAKLGVKISPGQIYPFLSKLAQQKYIIFQKAGGRDKKTYRLTESGKNFIKEQMSRFGDLIDLAIEPRIKICTHCGCKVISGGYAEKIKKEKLTFCCYHCAKAYKNANC